MTTDNKKIVKDFIDRLFTEGDLSVLDELAASVVPHVYKVVFENDRVRLLEVGMDPGAESALHRHADYLVYALSDGKVQLSAANGEGAEVDIAAVDVMWRGRGAFGPQCRRRPAPRAVRRAEVAVRRTAPHRRGVRPGD